MRRSLTVFPLVLMFLVSVATPIAAESVESAAFVPGVSRQPVYAASQSIGTTVGALRIPAIGVDETIRAGMSLSVIDLGVAHWVGTSAPGGDGNMVLAGHRTTFTAPFYNLDDLRAGDQIYVTAADGFSVLYKVSETLVVDPTDIWITYDTGSPIITLFACHPKGSAAKRIVVRGDLVAGRRIA
ncbi:MAG: class E sortase [Acidimicrobiia bacterium]|nr:class E sortase [Acidimicrobiia bacterium]